MYDALAKYTIWEKGFIYVIMQVSDNNFVRTCSC